MKRIATLVVAGLVLGLAAVSAVLAGNGGPSGPHYNLNLIGTSDKNPDMSGSSGHVIFVKLAGRTDIMLCESGVAGSDCSEPGFYVLDRNGTDGEASFALPNPDPTNSGTTSYSVFARGLGTPGKYATMKTCAMDPTTGEEICSVDAETLTLSHTKNSKFQNVSRQLLYIWVDLNGDGTAERHNIFNDALQDSFWQYDNHGQRIVQLRFYDCSSMVDLGIDTCGRTGK